MAKKLKKRQEDLTMCELVEEVSLKTLKSFLKDPKFMCKRCGRVAERKKNLCKPDAL